MRETTHYEMSMQEYKEAIGGGYVDPEREPEMLCRTGDAWASGTRIVRRVSCPACVALLAARASVSPAVKQASRSEAVSGLRADLPEGSTVWTVTQHVTRSGRPFVLPLAFLSRPEDPLSAHRGDTTVASIKYVLGEAVCEACGYAWNHEHMGWEGNVGEDAGAGIVARLGSYVWNNPTAYYHGRA